MSSSAWLGLDVGGANLKYAVAVGRRAPDVLASGTLPFPLWREPEALGEKLREAGARAREDPPEPPWRPTSGPPRIALTLTAELADCFPDRAAGVRQVLDAATEAWPSAAVRVWTTAGSWSDPDRVREEPRQAASANWLAPATWLARRRRDVLLGDLGSTTTDLVPVRGGAVGTGARTDLERLASGELVYTGLLRTPVAALVGEVELEDGPVPVAAERFAVAADAHLWLGSLTPDGYRCETPDGGPRTREAAGRRLARMLCSDPEELGVDGIRAVARRAVDAQARSVVQAVRRLEGRLGGELPGSACCTGVGADLLSAWLRRAGLEVVEAPGPLAGAHAAASTAGTLALLALEDDPAGGP